MLSGCTQNRAATDISSRDLEAYENRISALQEQYMLPSVSIAIVSNQKTIYAKGFGYADIENSIPATGDTPYRIASITKPVASVIMLRLAEKGLLDLDTKLSECWPGYYDHFSRLEKLIREKAPQYYGLIEQYNYENGTITLRHMLTHTSEGVPGNAFKYSGFLYSQLSHLVDSVSDRDFYTCVKEIILDLDMDNSLPCQADTWRPYVINNLAKPYVKTDENKLVPGRYPQPDLGAGAGIVASVTDLAKFDIAFDRGELISDTMRKLAFTPAVLNNGTKAPYGLGWFIGTYNNHTIVFHTGWQPGSFSGLYAKIIDRDLTVIMLANSEGLIAPFMNDLGTGNIGASPFIREFLDLVLK